MYYRVSKSLERNRKTNFLQDYGELFHEIN